MGIYLSSPKTEKFTEDGENYRVRFGMSAMQGWRTTMEDSHAALPDSDSSTSFFGVCDGHGGLMHYPVHIVADFKAELCEDDDFIVLTCDGIWDCLSSQQLVDFIHEQLNTENKLSGVCERVLDRCLAPSMRLQMSNSRDLDLPTANLYRNKIN